MVEGIHARTNNHIDGEGLVNGEAVGSPNRAYDRVNLRDDDDSPTTRRDKVTRALLRASLVQIALQEEGSDAGKPEAGCGGAGTNAEKDNNAGPGADNNNLGGLHLQMTRQSASDSWGLSVVPELGRQSQVK
jgi:hypothetical protein